MKIIIFGATGSGKTTLASKIAKKINFKHLDSDNYYWEKKGRPFEFKRDKEIRNNSIRQDLENNENVIVSGSIFNWDKNYLNYFDLVIFLYIDNSTRMGRLNEREIERYGNLIYTDKWYKKNNEEFIDWASSYENPDFYGSNLDQHRTWLNDIDTDILLIENILDLEERIQIVKDKLRKDYNIN